MAVDYEVTYILRPNMEEAEAGERTTAIAEGLKTNGGEVLNLEVLGKKRLAYEINDVREGIYAVMRFQSTSEAAHELERQLGLNEDVMRALLIKLDKHALEAEKAGPPPPLPEGFEGRGDGRGDRHEGRSDSRHDYRPDSRSDG